MSASKDDLVREQIYSASGRRPILPGAMDTFKTWVARRDLIASLTKRDVLQRYRGSILGIVWSFITPVVLMLIYTVVFAFVFKLKWSPDRTGFGDFVLMLFCGLIPYTFFTEVLSTSGGLIIAVPSYVRKVAFPTEALPVALTGGALVHALISMVVLLAGIWGVLGEFHWTVLYLPVVWIPFIICALAASLLFSAIGVFIRDIEHATALLLSALFFASPIFYPASRVPAKLRFLLWINPIAYAASNIRKVCILGLPPNWVSWSLFMLVSIIILIVVAGWFQSIKKRFPDVV